MPPTTPPRIFGSNSGKSPEFSFGSPDEDSQGRLSFNAPRASHRAGSSRDGSSTLNEPTGFAALVAEMRDVKELLRAVLMEKSPVQQHQDHLPIYKTGDLLASPLYDFYSEAEMIDLARNQCPNEGRMGLFREHFLSQFCPEDAVLRIHRTDPSQPRPARRPYLRWSKKRDPSIRRSLESDDAKHLVEADWPEVISPGKIW
ncbi:hypothetical protein SLS62_003286 [Diatrype stigma]|uniref:Uncharacterized protein n=1 Tax=Diatrype stigma TaxID=117547 RepID=A0AAN9YQ16_9PEZI